MEQRWNILDQIARAKLIGQVRGQSRASALETASALIDGGMEVVEVTFTTPDAHRIVEDLNNEYGDRVLVGAGNLTSANEVGTALASGAGFLSSPGCDADLLSIMQQTELMVLPGIVTPSEIMLAVFMGADAVRLFPGSIYGTSYLHVLRKTFPKTSIFATEEMSLDNVNSWITVGAAAVTVGDILATAPMECDERTLVIDRVKKLIDTVHTR
jgi:2-dehydro-3-deoxyphosphogluconate aldolase/(4S)-4-hydroxy-2-oxoglutarate aldolase